MTFPYPGIDTFDQPLQDAWWTPGWNAQTKQYVAAPPNPFNPGSPAFTYVNVTHSYFDTGDSPLGGFLTFMPSDNATYTVSGTSYRIPQRLAGIPLPIIFGPGGPGWATNQFGSGRCYIQGGLLAVALMPTDLSGLVTDGGQAYTYTVVEHMLGGRQFTINVPSASSNPVDLDSLIVANTTTPYAYDPRFPLGNEAAVGGTPVSNPTLATFSQAVTNVTTVTVTHNLGVYPEVTILDSAGNQVFANLAFPNVNQVTVTFTRPFTGTIVCNA